MARIPSPESRLVFRTADASASPASVRALAADVRDWPQVQRLAEREGAVGVLWRALRAVPDVPPPLATALRRSAMVSEFHMQRLATRLGETTAILGARGVPVLLLKGAAVGARVDPSFRSRPMTDVDLLVRPADVPAATAALREVGWVPTTDPVALALLHDAHHLPPFVDAGLPGVRLELHRALFPRDHGFALDEAAVWRDASAAAPPFAGASVPSTEHLVLHAAAHFAWQHMLGFGAWRTFRTLSLLSAQPDLDWDRLGASARAARLGTSLHWTLRLARGLAGIASPPLPGLAPPLPDAVAAALDRHFITSLVPEDGPSSPSVQLSRLLWRVALRPRWSGHPAVRRWEDAPRWDQARGREEAASWPVRLARQATQPRTWWTFITRTLLA